MVISDNGKERATERLGIDSMHEYNGVLVLVIAQINASLWNISLYFRYVSPAYISAVSWTEIM